MTNPGRSYLPAAGRDWALPLYDPVDKLLGGSRARRMLLEQAVLRPGHRVLDLGCGTGTFAIQIKQLYPETEVVGVDPDPKALARAGRKAERAGVSIRLDRGFADDLPYPGDRFDRVFSVFMFHRLPAGEKPKALGEVRRVLAPSGSFHLLDFAGPNRHALFVHSKNALAENSEARILALLGAAGLAGAAKTAERELLFGLLPIAYYRAGPPETAG